METMESTALAIPDRTDLVAMFTKEGGIDPLIARIEEEVRAHVPDLTTKKGRDAIASLAYKVARSKTALDDAGKALTEEQRKAIAVVDAARRKVRDKLDALRDEARKPLDDWEAAEQERVAKIKRRLKNLSDAMPAEETAEDFAALIARVEAVNPEDGSWGEFDMDAGRAKDATLKRLRDAAELSRLRREAAERAEADRIAAEQAAAAEQAQREAAAREERERLEREAEAERQRQEQELAAQAAAEATERERKAAADREEALRMEAEEREADLQRQLEAQKAETERAAQAERDRLAEQQRAAQEAEDRRAADVAYRARIRKEIIAALESLGGEAISTHLIADAILEGKVPHVKAVL